MGMSRGQARRVHGDHEASARVGDAILPLDHRDPPPFFHRPRHQREVIVWARDTRRKEEKDDGASSQLAAPAGRAADLHGQRCGGALCVCTPGRSLAHRAAHGTTRCARADWQHAPNTCRNFAELVSVRAQGGDQGPRASEGEPHGRSAAAGQERLLQQPHLPPGHQGKPPHLLPPAADRAQGLWRSADGGTCAAPWQEFMAQTGDPTGTGRGGQSIYGYFHSTRSAPAGGPVCWSNGFGRVGVGGGQAQVS
jgi:cyclophilin family peptidyl-prolyl cis-trans isomerase